MTFICKHTMYMCVCNIVQNLKFSLNIKLCTMLIPLLFCTMHRNKDYSPVPRLSLAVLFLQRRPGYEAE